MGAVKYSLTYTYGQFNHIRNKQSLAHDNQMLSLVEDKYVLETVLSLLRFFKALDERNSLGNR